MPYYLLSLITNPNKQVVIFSITKKKIQVRNSRHPAKRQKRYKHNWLTSDLDHT